MSAPTPTTAETDAIRHQRLHEAITMALYVSISLQAVVLATRILDADQARIRVASTVFLTAVGLLLAHQMAFRMSSRLLNHGELDESSLAVLSAQGLGGLPVAVVAALPILVVGAVAVSVGCILGLKLAMGH